MAEAALMHRVESEATPALAFMTRVRSVDVVRGLVCVLMAIDHVRVYSGIPAGGPAPGVFLTRWVTHFVAPAFCFFAGTAAFFLGKRLNRSRPLCQQVDQFKASPARHRFCEPGELIVEFILETALFGTRHTSIQPNT